MAAVGAEGLLRRVAEVGEGVGTMLVGMAGEADGGDGRGARGQRRIRGGAAREC